MLRKLNSIYKHFYSKNYIKKNEHVYNGKSKYLFVENTTKNADMLLVVFSAFTGDILRYNYFYSFEEQMESFTEHSTVGQFLFHIL